MTNDSKTATPMADQQEEAVITNPSYCVHCKRVVAPNEPDGIPLGAPDGIAHRWCFDRAREIAGLETQLTQVKAALDRTESFVAQIQKKNLELQASTATRQELIESISYNRALGYRLGKRAMEEAVEVKRLVGVVDELGTQLVESSRYEAELESIATLLQHAHPVGEMKGIGLLEVSEVVRLLADEKAALEAQLAAANNALRSLASWLGNGGYNAEKVDAAEFEAKIRDGVDRLLRIETARVGKISDTEMMALLRRVNGEFEQEIVTLTALLASATRAVKEEWLDIATAPRDGTNILVAIPIGDKHICIVGFFPQEGASFVTVPGRWNYTPTLWRPIPVVADALEEK